MTKGGLKIANAFLLFDGRPPLLKDLRPWYPKFRSSSSRFSQYFDRNVSPLTTLRFPCVTRFEWTLHWASDTRHMWTPNQFGYKTETTILPGLGLKTRI